MKTQDQVPKFNSTNADKIVTFLSFKHNAETVRILQFLYSILNFVRKNPKKIFSKCHAWISSYSVNRVGEKDNVQTFSLSRSA